MNEAGESSINDFHFYVSLAASRHEKARSLLPRLFHRLQTRIA